MAVPPATLIPDPALLRNLALGAGVRQSSDELPYVAERAVDGNPDGRRGAGSVSRTALKSQPWWRVDLGANRAIGSLLLLNRTDCCMGQLSSFRVMVAKTPLDGRSFADLEADPTVWKSDVEAPVGSSLQIPVERIGRYLRVQLKSNSAQLALAEVVVLGLTESQP